MSDSATNRAIPFHCPYCGDENLFPHESEQPTHGAWECRACLRAFSVKMLGLISPRTKSTQESTTQKEVDR